MNGNIPTDNTTLRPWDPWDAVTERDAYIGDQRQEIKRLHKLLDVAITERDEAREALREIKDYPIFASKHGGNAMSNTPITDAAIIERRHIHKMGGSVELLELIDADVARDLEIHVAVAREMAEKYRASFHELRNKVIGHVDETGFPWEDAE